MALIDEFQFDVSRLVAFTLKREPTAFSAVWLSLITFNAALFACNAASRTSVVCHASRDVVIGRSNPATSFLFMGRIHSAYAYLALLALCE